MWIFWLVFSFLLLFLVLCFFCLRLCCLRPRRRKKVGPAPDQPPTAYDAPLRDARAWFDAQPFQELSIQSRDGVRLVGSYLPAQNPRAVLLLFHGFRSSARHDLAFGARYYHSLGLSLLLPDQRAHGRSGGRFLTYGVREQFDCLDWIQYLVSRNPGTPILLGGISMGATTVLLASGHPLPPQVCGILADCGFSSPYEIIRKVMVENLHLPRLPLLPLTALSCRLFAGFRLRGASTYEAVRHSHTPTLFLHGTADSFVPAEMSQRAFDACAAPKRLLLVPEAEHGYSFLVDEAGYRDAVAWLLQFLPQSNTD